MIRRRAAITLSVAGIVAAAIGAGLAGAQPAAPLVPPASFAAIDVYVDSVDPLAAWQFELSEATGAMAVVGIENGDSEAYAEAPHYDLEAVAENRADHIIVADYSLARADDLPTGRTRVATVHVRLTGAATPQFSLQLIAAGNARGDAIPAEAIFEIQDGRAE